MCKPVSLLTLRHFGSCLHHGRTSHGEMPLPAFAKKPAQEATANLKLVRLRVGDMERTTCPAALSANGAVLKIDVRKGEEHLVHAVLPAPSVVAGGSNHGFIHFAKPPLCWDLSTHKEEEERTKKLQSPCADRHVAVFRSLLLLDLWVDRLKLHKPKEAATNFCIRCEFRKQTA